MTASIDRKLLLSALAMIFLTDRNEIKQNQSWNVYEIIFLVPLSSMSSMFDNFSTLLWRVLWNNMWCALIANGLKVANLRDNLKNIKVDENHDEIRDEIFKVSKVLRSCDDLFFPSLSLAVRELRVIDIRWIFNFFPLYQLSSHSRSFNRKKIVDRKELFLMSKVYRLCRVGGEGTKRSSLCCVLIEIWKNVSYSCEHKKHRNNKKKIYSCDDDR